MVFAPDTEMNIAAAVELVNTARRRDGHDAMATVDDVSEFYTRWGYTARHDGDAAELAAVRDAREQIAVLWDVDRDTAAGVLNEMLARGGAVPVPRPARRPRLAPARHRAGRPAGARSCSSRPRWRWPTSCAATSTTGCSAARPTTATRSSSTCSRNRSRRFCDVNGCANRAHVAAYRARQAGERTLRHGDVVS